MNGAPKGTKDDIAASESDGRFNWLAVSPSWVRDHATGRRRPAMPHIKLGKSLRFDENRVAEWSMRFGVLRDLYE
jgi:hypothetical protein